MFRSLAAWYNFCTNNFAYRTFFRLYLDESRSDSWSEVEKRLIPLSTEVRIRCFICQIFRSGNFNSKDMRSLFIWHLISYVFGPPGSLIQMYGFGSFYHQSKLVRKILIPTVLWLLYDFLSLKNDVNVVSKSNMQDGNKKLFFLLSFFCLLSYFLKLHLHHFSKIKSHKEVTKQEEWRFFSYYFCLMMNGIRIRTSY